MYSLVGVSMDRLLAVFRPLSYSQAGPRLDLPLLLPWLAGTVLAALVWLDQPGRSVASCRLVGCLLTLTVIIRC